MSGVVRILPAGDAAVLVEFGDRIDPALNGRALALAEAVRLEETFGPPVPAYASVLVPFDAERISFEEASNRLARLAAAIGSDPAPEGVTIEIPVRYGGADGPDLDEVAALHGLRPHDVVAAHASVEYRVHFLGFLPGFAYLGTRAAGDRHPEARGAAHGRPGGERRHRRGADGDLPTPLPRRLADPRPDRQRLVGPAPRPAGAARPGHARPLRARRPARLKVLEVIEPGLLTTVQDGGRPGLGHLGVPVSGACDRTSLAIANLLIGNHPDDAALELTLAGGRYRVLEPLTVGLAGADLGGVERASGRRLAPGAGHVLAAGETIEFMGAEAGRAYLAVPGGVDVPAVLGSRSTCLPGAFGGHEGRPLRAGDVIRPAIGRSVPGPGRRARWPGSPVPPRPGPIRVLAGPHLDRLGSGAVVRLVGTTWTVAAASDRMGLRLAGATIDGAGGELVSHGVPTGAIQVTASGLPIALLADHQVTGGYPIVAVVATVDLPRLGQLLPGGTVRFTEVGLEEARAAQVAAREAFEQAAAALRDSDRWDDLWQSSGG